MTPSRAELRAADGPDPAPRDPMHRSLALGAAALALVTMGVTHKGSVDSRLASLEEASRRGNVDASARAKLELDLLQVRAGLDAAHAENRRLAGVEDELNALEGELDQARAVLARQTSDLTAQREDLDEIRALASRVDRIDALEEGVNVRWDGLVQTLEATTSLAQETRDELGRVRNALDAEARDEGTPGAASDEPASAWRAMVGPVVQLAGDATVGSGVLLPSRAIEGTAPVQYRTLLLTSWHVVRDIRADSLRGDAPVPVVLRDIDGDKRSLAARLVAHDAALDAALLVLDTTEHFHVGARLPSRARLAEIGVFHPVVAVGCPLGNDPIPTRGHLSDRHHEVSGEKFWMVSAPTYIGNSGGGIFASDSHELLGIFSKIYTHGAIRPTVIPHMGLATPLEAFYDWLDSGQIAEVIDDGESVTIVLTE